MLGHFHQTLDILTDRFKILTPKLKKYSSKEKIKV